MTADLGFIGLGHMGMPMLRRLLAAGHSVTVFDTRREVVEAAVGLGAHRASDPTGVADRAPTVLASLPGPAISVQVAEAVAEAASTGGRIARFVDLSTVGSPPPGASTGNWPRVVSPRWTVRSAAGCTAPSRARWH